MALNRRKRHRRTPSDERAEDGIARFGGSLELWLTSGRVAAEGSNFPVRRCCAHYRCVRATGSSKSRAWTAVWREVCKRRDGGKSLPRRGNETVGRVPQAV